MRIKQLMKATLILAGLIYFVSFAASSRSPRIHWTSFNSGSQQETKKVMMLYVYAPWCGYCQRLSSTTLSNPTVISKINSSFIPVKANIDTDSKIINRYGVNSTPTLIFLDKNKHEMQRYTGYMTSKQLINILDSFSSS